MRYEYVKIHSDPEDKFRCIEIKPKTLGTLLNEYSDEVHNKRETRIPYDQWKTLSSIANDPKATIQVFKLVIYCEYNVNHETDYLYIRTNESPFASFAIKRVYADVTSSGETSLTMALDKVGVCVKDCCGNFRNTTDILEELA